MALKRKKESKWLIVENRKVHCYLCGRKMLKASQRIYDAESGHYSHVICEKEKQLTGTNERRSAVKKIVAGAGVLGLTAVGVDKFTSFGRMSNSVFSSNAKDQTANPELETVITSQGIILPSLTSDPANPEPGQMWYRSDAGVTAHYDATENRVIYSNRIVTDGTVVTSKGIINGLSVLINDGQDFGPDTMSGATQPSQVGAPYTQTNGIQEVVNYITVLGGGKIIMKNGIYKVNTFFNSPSGVAGFVSAIWLPYIPVGQEYLPIVIEGESTTGFYQEGNLGTYNPPDNGVIIDATSLQSGGLSYPSILSADGAAISKFSQLIPTIKNITIRTSAGQSMEAFNFFNSANFIGDHLVADTTASTGNPPEPLMGVSGQNAGIVLPIHANYGMVYLKNSYVFNYYTGIVFASHAFVDNCFVQACYEGLECNGGNHGAHIGVLVQGCPVPLYFSVTMNNIEGWIDVEDAVINSWQNFQNYISYASGVSAYGRLRTYCDGTVTPPKFDLPSGNLDLEVYFEPNNNIASGTTAGTITQIMPHYGNLYKKIVLNFNGYENDTTTDQVIDYLGSLSFTQTPNVVVNTTGLTISISTTGITITTPDSTTTYSGIVIIEGY